MKSLTAPFSSVGHARRLRRATLALLMSGLLLSIAPSSHAGDLLTWFWSPYRPGTPQALELGGVTGNRFMAKDLEYRRATQGMHREAKASLRYQNEPRRALPLLPVSSRGATIRRDLLKK